MRLGTCVLVCLLSAAPAQARQEEPFIISDAERATLRPEASYVFNHVPNSGLVFEAQLAPRILIMDRIGAATARVLESDSGVWGWGLSATPMVKLRMFDETSNPVRTPSYMPKFNVQLVRMSNVSTDDDEEVRFRGPVGIWLLDLVPFGHHSNGQNGCLFTNQFRNADGECVEALTSEPEAVNKVDGSFSTNYIDIGLYYGRMYLGPRKEQEEYGTEWEWRAGVALQLNPKGYIGGSIDDELEPLYGTTRVSVEGNLARRNAWKCGRAEGRVSLQHIGDVPGVPRFITQVEGLCLPQGWGGTGLFVRFYNGQDYYNLGFAESISRLQFGFTLQQARFLSFRIPSI